MKNKNKKKWTAKKVLSILTVVTFLSGITTIGVNQVWAENEIGNIDTNSISRSKTITTDKLTVLNGTPMENAKPYIEKAAKYYDLPVELYLCIANAESSFKSFKGFNPFGIKPEGKLKTYDNWEHSINGFSQLLKYYYYNEGRITAEQLMPKYVGYQSNDWIKNCKKFYNPKIEISMSN